MNDQFLPRTLILGFALMWAISIAGPMWKDTNQESLRAKIGVTAGAIAFFGLIGYLMAFRLHWYPATDGSGTP